MHRGMEPGTAISAAHSSGTAPNPISRTAVAGKVLVTSAVAVNSTETMSSSTSSLRAMISRISSWERSVTWATVSSSTVVAPRRPLTMSAGGIAGHSTGIASAAPLSGLLRVRVRCGCARDRRGRQRPDLGGGQVAPPPRGQVRVAYRADPRPHEAAHGMPDGVAHAADLAVAALVDDEPQHAGCEHADLGGCGRAVVELDALAQRPQGAGS